MITHLLPTNLYFNPQTKKSLIFEKEQKIFARGKR